jgi:ribonuclease G
LQVNLEAAEEIVRQMHLRNLGGLILIDFIDMSSGADQRRLYDTMQRLMERDSECFQIIPISPLGIMQISRQRHCQSLDRDMRRPCPYCGGRGTIESAQSTAIRVLFDLMTELREPLEGAKERGRAIRIAVHPDVLQVMKRSAKERLAEIEESFAVHITVAADESIHRENFSIGSEKD